MDSSKYSPKVSQLSFGFESNGHVFMNLVGLGWDIDGIFVCAGFMFVAPYLFRMFIVPF